MSFLGRAKKFLQDLGTEAPSKTQTFNLACASGHRVRGERTEGYQALRCPACGEGVFVLPRSPLPEPLAPAGVAEARRARGRGRSPWVDEGPIELQEGQWGGDGAEIIWDDEQDGAPPEGGRPASAGIAPEDLAAAEIEAARRAEPVEDRAERPPRRTEGRGASTGASARRASASGPARARAGRPRPERAVAAAPEEAPVAVEPRRRRRGPPVGLIFLLLTVLILATVGWRMLKNLRAQYPLIAERGRDEGIPALEAGEFDHAFQLLKEARSAVEGLGGAVDRADEIIQAAKEAAVFVDLCPESLEDLLAKAGRPGSEDWESKFDKLYKGRYYLFDTFILATPEQGGGGAYELGYVVFPPGEATRFGDPGQARPDRFARIDLSDFELFTQASVPSPRGDPVTFGAKLLSIARDPERKHWVVRLQPDSGVRITHQGALKASGWPDPESVELPKEEQP